MKAFGRKSKGSKEMREQPRLRKRKTCGGMIVWWPKRKLREKTVYNPENMRGTRMKSYLRQAEAWLLSSQAEDLGLSLLVEDLPATTMTMTSVKQS